MVQVQNAGNSVSKDHGNTQEQKMHGRTSYGLRRDLTVTSVTGICPLIDHHMTNPEFLFLLRITSLITANL
jgi:hypothetical protein